MDDIRYPIGKFVEDKEADQAKRQGWIREIAELPARLRRAVDGLSAAQLDTPYRDGGWTSRQIVHHLADSHMNAFIRFKLGLTEDNPVIKPYKQDAWASSADYGKADPALSLSILEGMHARLAVLLASLAPGELARTFKHPERGAITLEYNLQVYAWHGRHHASQIEALRASKGWT